MPVPDKMLLVLDIDEVLVYAADRPLDPNFDFQVFLFYIIKRPFLNEFIESVFNWFNVAIWTAGSDDYAQVMAQRLIPKAADLKFIWSRKRCTPKHDYEIGDQYWVKDLKKVRRLGYNPERVLVIEDERRTMQRSFGNLILVRSFQGDKKDNELQLLIKYLDWIRDQENVRKIEKRYWREIVKNKVVRTD